MAGEVLRLVRLKDHKMHPQVEEGFHTAGDHRFSPAELGEIMLAKCASLGLPHRRSPSQAAPGCRCKGAVEPELKRAHLAKVLAAVRGWTTGAGPPGHGGAGEDAHIEPVTRDAAAVLRVPARRGGRRRRGAAAALLLPSCPHLGLVYDVLLTVVAATDAQPLRAHVDRHFLTALLALSKLTLERAFMRRSMANALLRFTNEASSLSSSSAVVGAAGVCEVLEICGTIINGFMVPLKEEHRGFLMRVFLPLHRTGGSTPTTVSSSTACCSSCTSTPGSPAPS
ncbi:hypothetical protein ACQ4PT_040273 [Festuca glaucescens]